MMHSLARLALALCLLALVPAITQAQYTGYSQSYLEQVLADAEREAEICRDGVLKTTYSIDVLNGNIEAGTAEPDYVREKIGFIAEERARLWKCLMEQRKIITEIQQELGDRLKGGDGSIDRDAVLKLRKRADAAMAKTNGDRTKLNEIKKRADAIRRAHR